MIAARVRIPPAGIGALLAAALLFSGCPSFPEDGRYACVEDSDCPVSGQRCVGGACASEVSDPCEDVNCPVGQTCVSGLCEDEDLCDGMECDDGLICEDGACVPACADCSGPTPHCDVDERACVECLESAHCGMTSPHCDEDGVCRNCLVDEHCEAVEERCDVDAWVCVIPCADDCSAMGRVCRPDTAECVQCLSPADCDGGAGEHFTCEDDVCRCTDEGACGTGEQCNLSTGGCEPECPLACEGPEICIWDERFDMHRCRRPCEDSEQCGLDAYCNLDTGGTGFCAEQLCGPVDRVSSGVQEHFEPTGYGEMCVSDGIPGVCLGPVEIVPGVVGGRCRIDGPLGFGDSCVPDATRAMFAEVGCDGSSLCVGPFDGAYECRALCERGGERTCDLGGYCEPLIGLTGVCLSMSLPSSECTVDDECDGGHVCSDGVCWPAPCTTDEGCEDATLGCATHSGDIGYCTPRPCETQAHCSHPYLCVGDAAGGEPACIPACETDDPNACLEEEGSCDPIENPDNPLIGICR